jgi:cytochrome c oxidase subunit 1
MGIGFIVIAVYLIRSLLAGKPAPANPWGGATLEWQTTSPPPHDNFAVSPEAGDPYDLEAFRWDPTVGGYVKKSDAAVAVG